MSLAFLFIPINVAAYIGVPAEKNNDVSSAVNLMRNLGGSFGIAIAATIESRRLQYHRSVLTEHVYGGNSALQQMLAGAKATLMASGYSATDAARHAWAMIDGMHAATGVDAGVQRCLLDPGDDVPVPGAGGVADEGRTSRARAIRRAMH